MSRNIAREKNEYGLFLFFDNLKLLLSTITTFEEADRSQSLSLEDIDQATDRLMTAADTIQLLISDIESNRDFAEVLPILNVTLTKVRNLGELLQRYRNGASYLTRETAYSSPTTSTSNGPGRPRYVIEEEQIRFLRELHFPWKKVADLLGVSESTLRR